MGRFNANDTSNRTELTEGEPRELELFSDTLLAAMTEKSDRSVIEHVPSLRWWALGEERQMSRSVNICGYQQRAWEYYWAIRMGSEGCGVVLGIGSGAIGAPFELTSDKHNGTPPPTVSGRYGHDTYGYSAIALDADKEGWPFHDGKLAGVIFNHSFEHLENQRGAMQEALRVTRPGGFVCLIQPDMTYSRRGSIDETHTTEWCADGFLEWLRALQGEDAAAFDIVMHNTLDNHFSFDSVIRRR